MRSCACGCGHHVRSTHARYILGHHMLCAKRREESRDRLRAYRAAHPEPWNKGLRLNDSKANGGWPKGKPKPKRLRKRFGHPGRVHSLAERKKRSLSMKAVWAGRSKRETAELCRKAVATKRRNGTLQHEWGAWKGRFQQNGGERVLEGLLSELFPHDFKYVGNRQVRIGGYWPDFINANGRKEIVELFGDTVHGPKFTGRRRCDETRRRKGIFKKFGFTTAVIWASQLHDKKVVEDSLHRQLGRS